MPTCLSLVSTREPDMMALALDNHRTYCARFQYTHSWMDTSHIRDARLDKMHTLHLALQALRDLPEGELLMLIAAGSAVYRPIALDTLMQGRDVLLTFGRNEPGCEPVPQMNWLVLRNTPQARKTLTQAIAAVHLQALHTAGVTDAVVFSGLGALGYYEQLAGTHLNLAWLNDRDAWFQANIFVVNTFCSPLHGNDGLVHDNPFTDHRLALLVLQQVNAALHDLPYMQQPAYPPLSDEPYSAYNPDSPVALVTLYTHHINAYARISEHNVKRYCDRHGLAYHVYRAIPPDLDASVNGTWHKAWLLERHFDQHEWVIWIDADILFTNPAQKLTALLPGRDLLLAKDLGGYEFNAGVMGFRCTEKNRTVLARIQARIEAISDKSSVYASGSDQLQCVLALGELGLLDGTTVVDCLSVNTPPIFRTPSTMMVHYIGLGEPYRSMYMAMDDSQSSQL
jgi:hypothetical protein